jgi:hypothetical protein
MWGDAQRLGDSRAAFLRAILHHTGLTDHFQIRDLGQVGQDLALNAVGEERVLLVRTQIFKWEDRDALFRHSTQRRWTLPLSNRQDRGDYRERYSRDEQRCTTTRPFFPNAEFG